MRINLFVDDALIILVFIYLCLICMHRFFDCFKKKKIVVVAEEEDVLDSSCVIDNSSNSEKVENIVDNFTEGVLDAGTEAALAVINEAGDKFDEAKEGFKENIRDSVRETVSTQVRPAVNLIINEDVLVDDIPLTNEPRDRVRPGTPIPASLLESLHEVEGKE